MQLMKIYEHNKIRHLLLAIKVDPSPNLNSSLGLTPSPVTQISPLLSLSLCNAHLECFPGWSLDMCLILNDLL